MEVAGLTMTTNPMVVAEATCMGGLIWEDPEDGLLAGVAT